MLWTVVQAWYQAQVQDKMQVQVYKRTQARGPGSHKTHHSKDAQ